MAYNSESFVRRAEECVRVAKLTTDDLIHHELLQLRQSYLQTAERLAQIEKEKK